MSPYKLLSVQLLEDLEEDLRRDLARDPAGTIEMLGVDVRPFQIIPPESDDCSCDGIYYHKPRLLIGYVRTPRSRRESFTILHEFAHHLIRHNGHVLSELADMGDDGGKAAEERVCDAFASLILIPEETAIEILDGSRPLAQHLQQLYHRCHGSMEACAVRLAELIPGFGYMVIASPSNHTVRFASASPSTPYSWARESVLPATHRIWRAAETGAYRGQGSIIWPSGNQTEAWLDAIQYREEVHGVFSEHRHWKDDRTLSILEGGLQRVRGVPYRGPCNHCGRTKWGYQLHQACEETWCQHCRKCGCGATPSRQPASRICPVCGLTKRRNLFPQGSDRCRDCGG